MNILFFDVVPTNIVRFFKDVVDELSLQDDIRFHFLVEEDDQNDSSHIEEAYPFAASIGYVESRSVAWFKRFLNRNRIDAIFVNAQRIPDDLAIFAAHRVGIPSFMLQHGMYIPFLKRDVGFFVGKLEKTFRYLKYATSIANASDSNKLLLVLKYMQCFVLGRNQIEVGIDRTELNVDRVYVYGDYWKEFHKRQFGYGYDQQLSVGYPDLCDISIVRDSVRIPDSLCYICQTLVEDGRLRQRLQVTFFKGLVDICGSSGRSLHIKLHPRSNLQLYEYGQGKDWVHFHQRNLPHTEKYVGHYSTLIVKGFKLSGDVSIYEYVGHPTPSYFAEMASQVTGDIDQLRGWLKLPCAVKAEVDGYFLENPNLYDCLVSDFFDAMNRHLSN